MNEEPIDGMPATDAQIEAWSDEAERGYPVEGPRRRGRRPIGDAAGTVVPVRMDSALLTALTERAERDQLTRSEAIRAAVRAWISAV